MLGKLSCGTNLNNTSDCQRFGQLLWPSLGQIVKKLVRVLSIHRHAQKIAYKSTVPVLASSLFALKKARAAG